MNHTINHLSNGTHEKFYETTSRNGMELNKLIDEYIELTKEFLSTPNIHIARKCIKDKEEIKNQIHQLTGNASEAIEKRRREKE